VTLIATLARDGKCRADGLHSASLIEQLGSARPQAGLDADGGGEGGGLGGGDGEGADARKRRSSCNYAGTES
jgi:hypothetical protein